MSIDEQPRAKREYHWIKTSDGREIYCPKEVHRPTIYGKAPAYFSDELKTPDIHATGKPISSRSQLKREMKKRGLEFADGLKRDDLDPKSWNEAPKFEGMNEADYYASAAQAHEQLKSGTAPLTEEDRAICRRMDEQIKSKGLDKIK